MSDEILKIHITEKPVSPPYGDYDILVAYGIDEKSNFYEMIFTDLGNGWAGKLESIKNCFTGVHADPCLVEIDNKREAKVK